MSEITERSLLIVGPGRPPRAGVRADRMIKIRVTASEHDAIKAMADQQHQPIADVVRDAVNEFVSDYGERHVFTNRTPFE